MLKKATLVITIFVGSLSVAVQASATQELPDCTALDQWGYPLCPGVGNTGYECKADDKAWICVDGFAFERCPGNEPPVSCDYDLACVVTDIGSCRAHGNGSGCNLPGSKPLHCDVYNWARGCRLQSSTTIVEVDCTTKAERNPNTPEIYFDGYDNDCDGVTDEEGVVFETEGLEYGVDRAGADYMTFPLAEANPSLCLLSCKRDLRCKAFTYVEPLQGNPARCWLKHAIPDATPGAGVISGVVRQVTGSPDRTLLITDNLLTRGMQDWVYLLAIMTIISGGEVTPLDITEQRMGHSIHLAVDVSRLSSDLSVSSFRGGQFDTGVAFPITVSITYPNGTIQSYESYLERVGSFYVDPQENRLMLSFADGYTNARPSAENAQVEGLIAEVIDKWFAEDLAQAALIRLGTQHHLKVSAANVETVGNQTKAGIAFAWAGAVPDNWKNELLQNIENAAEGIEEEALKFIIQNGPELKEVIMQITNHGELCPNGDICFTSIPSFESVHMAFGEALRVRFKGTGVKKIDFIRLGFEYELDYELFCSEDGHIKDRMVRTHVDIDDGLEWLASIVGAVTSFFTFGAGGAAVGPILPAIGGAIAGAIGVEIGEEIVGGIGTGVVQGKSLFGEIGVGALEIRAPELCSVFMLDFLSGQILHEPDLNL